MSASGAFAASLTDIQPQSREEDVPWAAESSRRSKSTSSPPLLRALPQGPNVHDSTSRPSSASGPVRLSAKEWFRSKRQARSMHGCMARPHVYWCAQHLRLKCRSNDAVCMHVCTKSTWWGVITYLQALRRKPWWIVLTCVAGLALVGFGECTATRSARWHGGMRTSIGPLKRLEAA